MPIQSNIPARSIHPKHRIGSGGQDSVLVNGNAGLTREQVIATINEQRPLRYGWRSVQQVLPSSDHYWYLNSGNVTFDDYYHPDTSMMPAGDVGFMNIYYNLSFTGNVHQLIGGVHTPVSYNAESVWRYTVHTANSGGGVGNFWHGHSVQVPALGGWDRFDGWLAHHHATVSISVTLFGQRVAPVGVFVRFTFSQELLAAGYYYGFIGSITRTTETYYYRV